jgi:hypothetical protein
MKSAALFLIACIATAPVTALERQGNVLTMSDEEAALCVVGEGCILVPKETLLRLLKSQREQGEADAKDEAEKACKSAWRDRT